MANVTLKIKQSEISQDRIDQLNQKVTFNDNEQTLFELVCRNRGLRFSSIDEWVISNDYYQINFVTVGDFVLDKIKRWSGYYDFLHDCRIHAFVTTALKHGYYQIIEGSSSVGYSILKDRPDLVMRLRNDVTESNHNDRFTKKLSSTSISYDTREDLEVSPIDEYSFFSFGGKWIEDELFGSLQNFDPVTHMRSDNSLFV